MSNGSDLGSNNYTVVPFKNKWNQKKKDYKKVYQSKEDIALSPIPFKMYQQLRHQTESVPTN